MKIHQNLQLGGNSLVTTVSILDVQSLNKSDGAGNTVWLDGSQGIIDLTWRTGLLEQIRSYLSSAPVSRSGKSEDVYGILLGYKRDESVQVMTWRPITRTKEAGYNSGFSGKDEQSLRKLLEIVKTDRALNSMEVLGWFRSRVKGEPELEEQDIRFHEKFFQELAQFIMVVRPSHQRSSDAAVYVRNQENEFEFKSPVAKLSLKPGPVAVNTPLGEIESIPAVSFEAKAVTQLTQVQWMQIASLIFAAAVLVGGLIAFLQWNSSRPEAHKGKAGLGFEVSIVGNEVKAKWNTASSLVQAADTAQLFLGEDRLQISHAELEQGFLRVPMKTTDINDTEISLKVGDKEEFAQLVTAARQKN